VSTIDNQYDGSHDTTLMQNTNKFPVIPVVAGIVIVAAASLLFGLNKTNSGTTNSSNSISTSLVTESTGSNFASRLAQSKLQVPNGYPAITALPGTYLGSSDNFGTVAKPNYSLYYKADKTKVTIKQAAEHYTEEFKKQGFAMESLKERPYGEATSFNSYGTKDRGDVSVQSYVDLINTDEVTVFLHPMGI
jgi:hypothetical protein